MAEPPREVRNLRRRRRVLASIAAALGVLVVAAAGGAWWLRNELTGSLPQLDGERVLPGLSCTVRVERDARGMPVVRGANRLDVARATGFLHAQDRYFQMDLLRRQGAGELAELFGEAAVEEDQRLRLHRLRSVAGRALNRLPARQRTLLDAYTEGVHDGLAALDEPPFEYLVLDAEPRPWSPQDSLLVLMAMFLGLQDPEGGLEATRGRLASCLPTEVVDFLTPRGTSWDAPLLGPALATPAVPGPEVLDLRHPRAATRAAPAAERYGEAVAHRGASNAFAVAGAGEGGAAWVANDIHLDLAVPNVWYPIELHWPGHTLVGATLPGLPLLVVGSNTQVAWGVTNALTDATDLVEVMLGRGDRYRTAAGWRPLRRSRETIRVAGGEPVETEVLGTAWGPLIETLEDGRAWALRWIAHEPSAVDLGMLAMEDAGDVGEALTVASASGVPNLNLLAADAQGRIGWTLAGRLPRRRAGLDGRTPASWRDGDPWRGWLAEHEIPRLEDPAVGALWSGNQRTVGGEALGRLGDGGYLLGARAGQIRERLAAFTVDGSSPSGGSRVGAGDLLAVQLDDRASFYDRWRDLLLEVLREPITVDRRHELTRLVAGWDGRAAVDSAGFRMIRTWRLFLGREIFSSLLAGCGEKVATLDLTAAVAQHEGPLWRLVEDRPPHFLPPRFPTWDERFEAAIDALLAYYPEDAGPLAQRTWGERNTSRIQHPLSLAVPPLGRWLDMPAQPLPGDDHMPRVQAPAYGATLRLVVSPGREEEGLLHMPGGVSGHPLSPHYRDGHAAWASGRPTPLLAGAPRHTLRLVPREEDRSDGCPPLGHRVGRAGEPGWMESASSSGRISEKESMP